MHLEFLHAGESGRETGIGQSAIALDGIQKELLRMMSMAEQNVKDSFDAVQDGTTRLLRTVTEREEYIDFLNKEISKYISGVLAKETNPQTSRQISVLFKVCGNLERIGDHA